jgi:hypothetical protein
MAILILGISFLYRTASSDLAIPAQSNTRSSTVSAMNIVSSEHCCDPFVSRVSLSRKEIGSFGCANSYIIQSLLF